jgi:hypothetical protein
MRSLAVEAEMMLGQDVKPASAIESWPEWPDDVRGLLMEWNRGSRDRPIKLSFHRCRLFDCADCSARCEGASSGAASINGQLVCDDCLIERARAALREARG